MSTNLSGQHRQALLSQIQALRLYVSVTAQEDTGKTLLSCLENLEKDLSQMPFGLEFQHHQEEIQRRFATHAPILTEEKELFLDRGGPLHFLLEGDNLASLHLMEKTHRGRIQMIYIDPPYNTGNKDFTYDDQMVDGADSFRHSKWLSFMQARLEIARELLTEQGVIFLSIDDNEMAHLKLLCDGLFGEENFVANIVVKSNPRGSQSKKAIASVHEYLLVYAKNITKAAIIGHPLTDAMKEEYQYQDSQGPYRLLGLRQRGGFWRASQRPNLWYPFYVDPVQETLSLEEDDRHTAAVWPRQPTTGEEGTWRWSREKAQAHMEALVPRKIKRQGELVWDIYQKDYLAPGGRVRRTKAKTLWDEKEVNYQNAAKELRTLFGTAPFTYAKPIYLVSRAMEMVDFSENPYILDFFAGSGTTGHAVMRANAADGGNRRFILCTNNENQICRQVTYPRLARAMEQEQFQASLKYLKVGYVPTAGRQDHGYGPTLLAHSPELVELETGEALSSGLVAVLLTQEALRAFLASPERLAICQKLYLCRDLPVDGPMEQLLKEHHITLERIPDRFYRE